jgi:hypothetical protein
MKAKLNQIGNDLFWNFFDIDGIGKVVTWQGYDDAFWWEKVSKSDNFRVKGNLKLDPYTGEVEKIQ